MLISGGAWADLPKPKLSCNTLDLQSRYARLFAAGSFCGKDENSTYAQKLNTLFLLDQNKCKVSSEQIDPSDEQVDSAFQEIESLPGIEQKSLCSSIDKQIKSLI